jgi:hypothetical protein
MTLATKKQSETINRVVVPATEMITMMMEKAAVARRVVITVARKVG